MGVCFSECSLATPVVKGQVLATSDVVALLVRCGGFYPTNGFGVKALSRILVP